MSASSSFRGMDVAELLRAVDVGRPLVLLDLRTHEEVARWRVEGRRPVTIVHVPYFDFIEDTDDAIARVPRDAYVVAVCSKGGSSAMVVDLLREAGIPARNLDGGMEAYGAHLETKRVPATGYGLWQIHRRGTGCLAYVVEAGGEALIVDPSRALDWYERFVAARELRVVRVVDTHLHADHVSGGPALAARFGVPYAPGLEAVSDLRDGMTIRLGAGVDVSVTATPGHTPGSTAYRVGTHLLTGDTLFVRGVGRPDLGERALARARVLHRTLHERLGMLPDDTTVLPAHAGSPDEIGDDGIVAGRLGTLRQTPELRLLSEDEFAQTIAAGVEPPPLAYREIVRANAERLDVLPQHAAQWELRRNQCAARGRVA